MGSLQTSPEEPAAVRTIARAVGGWIDRLGAVWVEGQVSQVNRRQGMSLVFLTLRDTLADLSMTVTCPRVVFDSMNPPLVEGASVLVHGKISYYPNRGTLSLEARELRAVGLGELLARLERLRQTLAAEGLFARETKRSLPFLPGRIGLVTSPGSAAERDVVEVARRRWAGVDIVTSPAAMQGPRSTGEVIAALQRLDADPGVEVIVIARGGGSVEDLLPFSDEELIRAVSAATTPVVSAIGHEPDSPLLDLVADVRAATPTEAAKIVVPDMSEEARRLGEARDRLRSGVRRAVEREQHALDAIRSRPVLRDPRTMVAERVEETRALTERARRSLEIRLDRGHDDLDHQRARVRALSPLATLQRGYAVLQDADGAVVTSVRDVDAGAALAVRLADGRVHTTAVRTDPLEAGPDE